ncbi:N-acetyl-alpha-D-glucosaminyl L-malate synthase BshA [Melghirimyces profundicolus]|uniref:N-acetyl-alpha-D-glucosaminyl L-malate synthase BshA n=1 Tax=Melghirimyces profundicolus TaxID=1242148 RepID=A0A2T6BV42_9BACL|nr:N-acetyl-alpha-D-glucosaminyl L-malate synthase BshA [Melghirimyces profundicolus]PTX59933.1 N-acetyl-alpha-D-glucosaminyl L-malate synthase BshA [Melghirimyces profundicolus]
MRIGITCYPSHGGSGVVATELGKLMAERGHQVHFISYDMPFRLGRFYHNVHYHEVEANRYAVFRFPPYDLALANRMAQVAKIHQLDLIHVHYAVPHALCAYLAKKMVGDSLKVVTTLHGTDITVLGEDPSLKDIICFGINHSDAVTAVSDDLVRQTRELFCVDKQLTRIYNFVDPRVYQPLDVSDIRSEYAATEEKLLLHISNFRAVKRTTDVIRIFEKVQQEVAARLILVGEGPEWSRTVQMVKELGLESRVMFLGKQDEVARLISLADLLLLPSSKESFGLVALEAMACGVPTVGSNAGGLPEVVVHGETGYLAEIGDTEAMAAQAVRLLSDPVLYRRFSENGVRLARERFSAEKIAGQYEDLYRQVIGK